MNDVILKTLNEFKNKGAAWQSQPKAEQLLHELRDLLPYEEWFKLKVAHNYYKVFGKAGELYSACKELTKKYLNKRS